MYIINFIAYFSSVEKEKYSLIFRDYNLSDSLGLSVFLESNKEAKVIVYPHAVNVQQSFGRFPPLRRRCDLWLENTWLSDHAASRYKKQLFVCGIPALAHAQEIFSFESNTVLFLTRNCSKEFGFSLDEALPVFDFFLNELSNQGLKVLVKHHPRDKNLHSWRKVQKKYSCVDECNESLSEISFNVSFCLTLFSSAGLFLVGRGVPVFDVSPYKKKKVILYIYLITTE